MTAKTTNRKTRKGPRLPDGLTVRRRRFVEEYLICGNGRQAVIAAGFNVRGAAADQYSCKLLKNGKVSAFIQKRMNQISKRKEVSAERVIDELARCGFSNIQDYLGFGADGVLLKDSSEITREAASAISEVSETVTKDGGSIKFKLHDKIAALDKLGKRLGLWKDNGMNINITAPQYVQIGDQVIAF